jgi:hypothetical protein
MHLEPAQAGAQSHSRSQCQAHPIPLYESDIYIYYIFVMYVHTLNETLSHKFHPYSILST